MQTDISWANLELLPAAPYSINSQSPVASLGLALARQTGIHAIGSDKRQDFDAWPGDFAISAAKLPMFSESAHGGEYLLMHIRQPELLARLAILNHATGRQIFHGDKQAVNLAWQLRHLLLQATPDNLLIEEKAGLFLQRGFALAGNIANTASRYAEDRAFHSRILDHIEDELDTQLKLEDLAVMADMSLLHFLRSFSHATGSTPHAYITERRLQRARRLLRTSNLSIAAIAADCGFAHQSHLGSAFRSRLGLSPLQYRQLPA
ncbi:helix-turn-helix domain-containing protein [Undibacterium sp. TJN19]|uniref:helix-turn-helix domain-containing protein n=1 Tax=Undibacterium sp. TJN19 TaxID=3413055 RepID=UPI003BF1CC30